MTEDNTVAPSDRAYSALWKAKKQGESSSDVVIRLSSTKISSLQKRGEMEIKTSDDRKLVVKVDQDLCIGAESCVTLAPEVFSLDRSQLGISFSGPTWNTEPPRMREVEEGTLDSDRIVRAAKSCPYKAITVTDAKTWDEIVPWITGVGARRRHDDDDRFAIACETSSGFAPRPRSNCWP